MATEVPRADALAFADTRAGQMALDLQHGKQFLEPQFQVGAEIFQRRFDLYLKKSDLSVIIKRYLLYCFNSDFALLSYHKSGAFPLLLTHF